ncbi:hypothetical protein BD408DRAFT_343358 [Parasitella parasitica]|nr:hypothetical protein BD408DRAFT_343358 [Parasitella parasitica]
MLQEYPTQIQPRSSSTRGDTHDNLHQDLNSTSNNHREVDADVSRILIDLANQVTSPNERSQPDPIMLLAAAAAVIDDEGEYKGRSYERREIRLYGRHASMLHRRYSERRHRYSRPSVSGHGVFSSDTWNGLPNNHIKEDEEMRGASQSEGTHAFSWQYLSMVRYDVNDGSFESSRDLFLA